jgi:hypothetical protein
MASRLLPFRRAFAARPLQLRTVQPTLRYSNIRYKSDSPQKDAQLDREKIDAQPNEYAKSGTDAETANNHDAAFDPNGSNDPEDARKEAGKGSDGSPLDTSPANPELSAGTSEVSPGAGKKDE